MGVVKITIPLDRLEEIEEEIKEEYNSNTDAFVRGMRAGASEFRDRLLGRKSNDQ